MCDVLMLDDDGLLREVAWDVLTEEGLTVETAACISTADAVLSRAETCRVLVTDRDLGPDADLDGFSFAADARSRFPDLRVVYTTGEVDLLEERTLSASERALPKPYLAVELLETVRDLLKAR